MAAAAAAAGAIVHAPQPEAVLSANDWVKVTTAFVNSMTVDYVHPEPDTPDAIDMSHATMYFGQFKPCSSHTVKIFRFLGTSYEEARQHPEVHNLFQRFAFIDKEAFCSEQYLQALKICMRNFSSLRYGKTYQSHLNHYFAVLNDPTATADEGFVAQIGIDFIMLLHASPVKMETVRANLEMAIDFMPEPRSSFLDVKTKLTVAFHSASFAEGVRRTAEFIKALPSEQPDKDDAMHKMLTRLAALEALKSSLNKKRPGNDSDDDDGEGEGDQNHQRQPQQQPEGEPSCRAQ